MSSSNTQLESSCLDGDIRFDLYAALGVAVVLAALFWRLYKLTVSARPQDMLPVAAPSAAGGELKLRQRDVAALPVFVHGGGAAVECAVCLAEMKNGERGRLLPGCGHRFHVECIDPWFRANSTCRSAARRPSARRVRWRRRRMALRRWPWWCNVERGRSGEHSAPKP